MLICTTSLLCDSSKKVTSLGEVQPVTIVSRIILYMSQSILALWVQSQKEDILLTNPLAL